MLCIITKNEIIIFSSSHRKVEILSGRIFQSDQCKTIFKSGKQYSSPTAFLKKYYLKLEVTFNV